MSFVQSITHLKNRPHGDQAFKLLQKVVSLVKPIMRKHDWHLPVLAEFFPDEDNLVGLNVNMGEKILLRLRPARAPDTFYEEEQVVLVMLHELTHNVHGPHDSKFYSFLSKLEDEYYALKRSGYAGEGFFSDGKRLGVGVSHDLPVSLGKRKAAEAAERRRQQEWIMTQATRLGGGRQNKSPRELAAEAAERRLKDQKRCGGGVDIDAEALKAAQDSVASQVIDLDSDEEEGPIASSSSSHRPTDSSRKPMIDALSTPRPSRSESTGADWLDESWTCTNCTLVNRPLTLQCDACLSERVFETAPITGRRPSPDRTQIKKSTPKPRPDPVVSRTAAIDEGWTCKACGEEKMESQFWMCRFCGHIKSEPVPHNFPDFLA